MSEVDAGDGEVGGAVGLQDRLEQREHDVRCLEVFARVWDVEHGGFGPVNVELSSGARQTVFGIKQLERVLEQPGQAGHEPAAGAERMVDCRAGAAWCGWELR